MAFRAKCILLQLTCSYQSHRFMSNAYKSPKVAAIRQSRMLKKLVVGNATERSEWAQGLPSRKSVTPKTLPPKRLDALSRIFLGTITDGLTTSTRAQELANLGLSVNKIVLSPCGRSLNVLWISRSLETDVEVAEILNTILNELRHNMVNQCVGGFVPHITFEKDISGCIAREVHVILESPQVRRDLEMPDATVDQSEDGAVKETPAGFSGVVTTNILGLKRADILARMKPVLKFNNTPVVTNTEEPRKISERLENIDAVQQKYAINDYISKQQKLEKRRFHENLHLRGFRMPMSEMYEETESGETYFEEEDDDDYQVDCDPHDHRQ